jgi:class 3 adenylate cyclase/tetratricopeptide (TPR) repeat protein
LFFGGFAFAQVTSSSSNEQVLYSKQMERASRQLLAGHYDSCQQSLSQALELAKRKKKFGWIAKTRNEIGVLLIYKGDYVGALSNIQEALSIYEKMGDRAGIAESHNNMGSIYYSQKEYEKARFSYGKCLVYREQGTDRRALGIIYNNMGDVNSKLGEFATALSFHRQSLAIWKELKSISGKAITLELMGGCMHQQGDALGALQMIKEGFQAVQGSDENARLSIEMGIRVGELLNELGRESEARTWCETAYNEALRMNSKQEIQKSCLCLFEANKALGNSAEALRFYQMHVAMHDSIFGQEMTKEVTRLELNYSFDKKQMADSLHFVAETQLQQERIQRQWVGLVSIGSVLLLVGALGFSIYYGKRKSDALLLNILPVETAKELKEKGFAQAKYFDSVTILFTDFKGFTQISEVLSPQELVAEIDECFSAFDCIMDKFGIEKIKTIGDAYMAAGGLPVPNTTHALDIVQAAIEIETVMSSLKERKKAEGKPFFEIRIGIHTGPVVAGIVGKRKFQYDIWGDAVNIASRMESSGEVGKINISEATYNLVKDLYECDYRGEIEAKGKGKVKMYFLKLLPL